MLSLSDHPSLSYTFNIFTLVRKYDSKQGTMRLLLLYAPDMVEKNDENDDDIASYLISFMKVAIIMISRFAFLFILVFSQFLHLEYAVVCAMNYENRIPTICPNTSNVLPLKVSMLTI